MKHVRRALSIIGLIVFCYIIIGQFVFPANAPDLGAQCEEMPRDNWFVVNEDGTRERIILPSTADSDIVLETTLPEDVGYDKDALWIRGKDMEVYVDNELRTKYEIDDYSILTDRSSDCFIMVSVYPQDAGKTLRINYSYNRGNVYTVFLGNRMGILKHLLGEYGAELFVGFAVLLLGGMSYFAALGYQIIYRKYLELRDLSFAVLLGGIWVISNSVFRQIFARNVSVMSDTPFLVVLIMPFPLLVFFDSLQKRRHTKVISVVEVLGVINAVVCLTLFVTGVAEISKIFIIAGLYVIIAIVVMGYTMISDVVHRQIESYKYVAIGFGLFEVAVIIQIILYLSVTNGMFTGTVVAFGLLGFLIFAILHTIKELIIMSKETDDAKRSVKVKDEFLANMSHEIRTPLNGILGMNEMILRDTREPSTKKYAVNIKGAGNVLLTLINDILDLSKIEAGSLEIVKSKYELSSVLNDVVNMTRKKALDKDLEYKIDVSENIPARLCGDEIRVRQVMINIINNAVKYTRDGYVHIKVSTKKGYESNQVILCVEVKDSGIGIKPEDMDSLFKVFKRLDMENNKEIEGTGLGLHITDKFVKLMGGNIDVRSEYGHGSTFTIYIPQEKVDDVLIGDFAEAVSQYVDNMELAETTLYIPEAKLLIVDDNEMNLGVMEGLLRDTKAKIDLVTSGQECIDKAKSFEYDCILLDQMMPVMNGEQTLNRLKEENIAEGTPIIALTADAVAGAQERYIAKGFTDYISKPVQYEVLEDKLRKYIPKEKQLEKKEEKKELPVILLWGTDSSRIRDEKKRLEGVYKCVCVVGSKAKDKYLDKHNPDRVMQVM